MVSVKNLTQVYGKQTVLDHVHFKIGRGETVAITGPSGAGKSTLIRCLSGLEKPTRGEIKLSGDLGLVFQSFHLFPHLTALQNLTYAPVRKKRMSSGDAVDQARNLLAQAGLSHREHSFPATLSGGEKQRVAIARALMMEPKILILDEPTSALDSLRTEALVSLLNDLSRQGMTLIVVTHDRALTVMLGARVLTLDRGVLTEQGVKKEAERDFSYGKMSQICDTYRAQL